MNRAFRGSLAGMSSSGVGVARARLRRLAPCGWTIQRARGILGYVVVVGRGSGRGEEHACEVEVLEIRTQGVMRLLLTRARGSSALRCRHASQRLPPGFEAVIWHAGPQIARMGQQRRGRWRDPAHALHVAMAVARRTCGSVAAAHAGTSP